MAKLTDFENWEGDTKAGEERTTRGQDAMRRRMYLIILLSCGTQVVAVVVVGFGDDDVMRKDRFRKIRITDDI
jgi:hypothetical protein